MSDSLKVVLDSDNAEFGGHNRVDDTIICPVLKGDWNGRQNHTFVSKSLITIYICRMHFLECIFLNKKINKICKVRTKCSNYKLLY